MTAELRSMGLLYQRIADLLDDEAAEADREFLGRVLAVFHRFREEQLDSRHGYGDILMLAAIAAAADSESPNDIDRINTLAAFLKWTGRLDDAKFAKFVTKPYGANEDSEATRPVPDRSAALTKG
jgi:hypothetical protein